MQEDSSSSISGGEDQHNDCDGVDADGHADDVGLSVDFGKTDDGSGGGDGGGGFSVGAISTASRVSSPPLSPSLPPQALIRTMPSARGYSRKGSWDANSRNNLKR